MKSMPLLIIFALMPSHSFGHEQTCKLDLKHEGETFVQRNILIGDIFEGKSATEREAMFPLLNETEKELLLLGLSQVATESQQTLGSLLKDVADNDGTDFNVFRVLVNGSLEPRIYHVTVKRKGKDFGVMAEVVGHAKLSAQERPLLKIVTLFQEGKTVVCESRFR